MEPPRSTGRVTLAGFAVALLILAGLVYVVGIGDVLAAIASADVGVLLVVLLAVGGWIGAWSGSLYLTARVFGVRPRVVPTVLVYAHMMFLDNVVPFSSIGADAFAAVAVSRTLATDYETSLALVVTVDFVNFLPAVAFGTAGLGYLVVTGALGATVETLALTLGAVLVALAVVGSLAWTYRGRAGRTAAAATAAVLAPLETHLPRVAPPDPADVERRVDALVANVESMIADRRVLLLVVGLATAGWALLAATLWLSLFAIGYAIPVSVALLIVSLVTVVELVPLPGGVGTAESLFVLLLVGTTGVPPAAATAGILVHRAATYWLPVVLGGGVSPLVLADSW